jgi:hypothetical protein
MSNAHRQPLTRREWRQLRDSLYLAVGFLVLYTVTMLLTLVPHELFQSDLMGLPLFYALLLAVGSAIKSFPLAKKRPICLVWSLGLPLALFVILPLGSVIVAVWF